MNAPDPTWLAGYLYYTGAPETFLTQAVAPFVHTMLTQGWAEQCFFIRYGEWGPHIRLRFKGQSETLAQKVKPQFAPFFRHYYARYPSQRQEPAWVQALPPEQRWFPNNSVQFIAYEPEITRYGGLVGMRIAEQQFLASSCAILALLQDSECWSYDRALGAAIQLHLTFAAALGMDLYETAQFYTSVSQHWCAYAAPSAADPSEQARAQRQAKTRSIFAQHFTQQQATLMPYHEVLWKALAADAVFEQDWLNRWRHDMSQVGCALRAAQAQQQLLVPHWWQHNATLAIPATQQQLWPILESYVHMTNNRPGILNRDEASVGYLLHKNLQALCLTEKSFLC
jgi:hypothetical protein